MREQITRKSAFKMYQMFTSKKGILAFIGIFSLVLLVGSSSFVNAETYSYITSWGAGPDSADGKLNNPYGIAVDGAGNIYVADQGNSRIQKFDSNGIFITKWGTLGTPQNGYAPGTFLVVNGVAVDSVGNVYTIEYDYMDRVQKFDISGNLIATLIVPYGGSDTGIPRLTGIAVDSSGNIYLTDAKPGNAHIRKYSPSGNSWNVWSTGSGAGDGQFGSDGPRGIAVDSSGTLYVADPTNHRIVKFSSTGTPLGTFGSLGNVDFPGDTNGKFNSPYGVAVDSNNYVYVTEIGNKRVQKLDNNGNFKAKWGTSGYFDGGFVNPQGIVIDGSGNVYVSDLAQHNIQKFNVMWASTSTGVSKDTFSPSESMYATVKGEGQAVRFYVTIHRSSWVDGTILEGTGVNLDVSNDGINKLTLSTSKQSINVWTSPLNPGIYDIIMDANNNGVYNKGIDTIDQGQVTGLFVVPEYLFGGLAAIVACFVGFVVFKKRSSLPNFKRL